MALYLSLAGVFGICALERILGEKERKRIFAVCLFLLWLLATVRADSVGNDTASYREIFVYLNEIGLNYDGRFEIAYVCLNLIIGFLSRNFTVLLMAADAVIYLALYLLFDRYCENRMLTLVMFLLRGYWGQSVNIVRMELALAMVIFAFLCRENRKFGWMIVFAVLAPLFQKTSIVYLAGLFIPKRIYKTLCVFIVIAAGLVSLFLPQLMNFAAKLVPYFAVYLEDDPTYELGGVTLGCLLSAAVLLGELVLAGVIYASNWDDLSEEQRGFFSLALNMGCVGLAIYLIAVRFSVLDRCAIFYSLFAIILLPNAVTWMKKREDRILVTLLVIALCAAEFTVLQTYRYWWNEIIPYRSVLWL